MRRCGTALYLVAMIGVCLVRASADEPEVPLRVASFRADATPALAGSFWGGWGQALTSLEAPLWAKGVVIEAGDQRYVLCALDWCTLGDSAHELFCSKLAAAAGTETARVAVQCVHLHTAPSVNADAQKLLNQQDQPPQFVDLANLEEVADRIARQVRAALDHTQPVDRIGLGEAKVERVAANRRVIGADGAVHVRWSTCADAELRAAPEGAVDPLLKTVTFFDGDRAVVRLHYYATHPQSGGNDGRIGIDFVGDAREQLEQEESVPQIYFTGCAGDITVGKYNDGAPTVRPQLAARLLTAMRAAIASTQTVAVTTPVWRTVPVVLPPQSITDGSLAESRSVLADAQANPRARLGAAATLAFQQAQPRPILLSMLALGPLRIVHLPGEPMLEFQRYTQQLSPTHFVAVAGYGDGAPGYLCTEESYAQGGYEPQATRIAPSGEAVLKAAIAQLLSREP